MWPDRAKAILGSTAIVLLVACSRASVTPSGVVEGGPTTGSVGFNSRFVPHRAVPSAALPAILRSNHRPAAVQRARPFAGGAIYTAQYYHNDVKIYSVHETQLNYVEQLTDGLSHPEGMATTTNLIAPRMLSGLALRSHPSWSSKGALYIANTGASNIPVYISTPRGPTGPVGTLNDQGQFPIDVAASVTYQLVAVSNAFTTSGGSGSVSLFPASASSPSTNLGVSGFVEGSGIAIDSRGNCYWSYDDLQTFTGDVVEFPGCRGDPLTIVTGLGAAGGLAFDRNDDLFYIDQLAGVYKCAKNVNCKQLPSAFGDPVFLNFDRGWQDLWVSDASGYIDAVDPQTGEILSSTQANAGASDPPIGIAPAPSARY